MGMCLAPCNPAVESLLLVDEGKMQAEGLVDAGPTLPMRLSSLGMCVAPSTPTTESLYLIDDGKMLAEGLVTLEPYRGGVRPAFTGTAATQKGSEAMKEMAAGTVKEMAGGAKEESDHVTAPVGGA